MAKFRKVRLRVWKRITSAYLETLNKSMLWQMKEVIATGGGHTKYKLVDHHLIVTILVIKSTFCQGGAISLAKIVLKQWLIKDGYH